MSIYIYKCKPKSLYKMFTYTKASWRHSNIHIYIGDEMEVTRVDIDEPGEIKVTPKDTNETIETEVTSKDVEKADVFQVTLNDVDFVGRTLVTSTDLMYQVIFKSSNRILG